MLHDSARARAYDSEDTLVVGNPEDPTTAKREVVMQAHIGDGMWHRLTPNHQRTACGLEFNAATVVPRREQLLGPLCLKCFTDYERLVAADADAEEKRATGEHAPLQLRDWLDEPKPRSPNGKKRK